MSRYTLSLDDDLLSKFREICAVENSNCAEKIRELISMYIDSQNSQSLDDIYRLCDRIIARAGHITHETIQRKTNSLQEEKVLEYCQRKGYKIDSELKYIPGPVHKDKDMYEIRYFN